MASPMKGANQEELVFSQRHEANTLELFFDLFFVANLATFTTYHAVIDSSTLLAYVGFFAFLWSTWFQITLFDVRFARDSVYERVYKTIQYVVFVGYALVGSAFQPGGKTANNTNFRILCAILFISRTLLFIQYSVVFVFALLHRYNKLYIPLIATALPFLAAAVTFFAMTPLFKEGEESHHGIYAIWWVVMFLEAVFVIGVSCFWKIISFKKTHLVERMGLLTLIVIGEGAIGVTKTISKMMGKYGLDAEGCILVLCIIILLTFIWMLYFDNQPHGHYGTLRQQFWSCIHFPLHLSIVGVVEGAQQIALARYVLKNVMKVVEDVKYYCLEENLEGANLQKALLKVTDYFQLDYNAETAQQYEVILEDIYRIGNTTDVCSPEALSNVTSTGFPVDFHWFVYDVSGALFQANGAKLPKDEDPAQIADHTFLTVYRYFWGSVLILLACFIICLVLVRKHHKSDIFDWTAITTRILAFVVAAVLLAFKADIEMLAAFISSPWVLPTLLFLLLIILIADRVSAMVCNWNLKRKGLYRKIDLEKKHDEKNEDGRAHNHDSDHEDDHSTNNLFEVRGHEYASSQHMSVDYASIHSGYAYPLAIGSPSYASEMDIPLVPVPNSGAAYDPHNVH
ncbi:hypothetical protein M501DRAFT_973451 [Patellaria atrata CBS 101060]|uniref:Low temperature requirement A n=1 Tax=Patellaria atrata CBS 101060 TaxID=1346257 RepID=A0A9P4SBS6_9PEZI|nr:hypothetical protein M501DRAFT_973451 [Patellaria atrata CBS 101060]